jgi:hypothetical protein|tara:strand:- start:1290 stop:1613 length:324 start_codon:yes stop_codon:yes gene_type:complete
MLADVSVASLYELTEKDAHKSLYIAVIIQALLDITKPEVEGEDNEIRIQRDQAHAWFFASVGVTCDDFEAVCHYAGLEPQKVRSFACEVIVSGDVENVRRKFSSIIY